MKYSEKEMRNADNDYDLRLMLHRNAVIDLRELAGCLREVICVAELRGDAIEAEGGELGNINEAILDRAVAVVMEHEAGQ